jgi:SSS family solute:Na+ symporter
MSTQASVIALLVYLLAMIGVSLFFTRRNRNFEDFVLAHRSISLAPLMFTTWVANFGGGVLVGWTGGFYEHGLDWSWLPFGFVLSLVLFYAVLINPIRATKLFTLPDLLSQRYSKTSRNISSLLSIVVGTLAVGFQMLAFAGLLTALTGSSLRLGALLAAISFVLITAAGGLKGLIMTDILQGSISLTALPIATLIILGQAGGPDELWAKLPDSHRHFGELTRSGKAIGDAFALFGAIASSQVLVQQVMAAKSGEVAKRAMLGLLPVFMITFLMLWVLGSSSLILLGPGISAQGVLGQLIKTRLPAALALILFATLLGKITTSANAILMGVGSNIARDIYQPIIKRTGHKDHSLLVTRIAIAVIAVTGMGLALIVGDIITLMLICLWIAGVAVLVPLYGGYLWKRATARAAEASMVSGAVGVIGSYLLISPTRLHPTIVGFLLSLVVFVVVTLLTKNEPAAEQP